MKTRGQREFHLVTSSTLLLLILILTACAGVGPRTLSQGRADYNEAINKTEDEQMLLSIVKGRYGETFSLLAVNGIAANVRFHTNANVDIGFGPSENYTGNLVPFTGGLAYEENPTITYSPVRGEKYIRQMITPISLELLLLFMRIGNPMDSSLNLFVNRINDMRNPDFLETPLSKPDPRFQRFVDLNRELHQADVIHWILDPREDIAIDILITDYAPTYTLQVHEYLTLLGQSIPENDYSDIVLPIFFTIKDQDMAGIAVTTRSTGDMIQLLRAAVEVPDEHVVEGLSLNFPPAGPVGDDLHIYSSKEKPERATVAVRHRGYWFYIDDADMQTKFFYSVVRMLWSLSMAASTDSVSGPILTLPVSR